MFYTSKKFLNVIYFSFISFLLFLFWCLTFTFNSFLTILHWNNIKYCRSVKTIFTISFFFYLFTLFLSFFLLLFFFASYLLYFYIPFSSMYGIVKYFYYLFIILRFENVRTLYFSFILFSFFSFSFFYAWSFFLTISDWYDIKDCKSAKKNINIYFLSLFLSFFLLSLFFASS